LKLIRLESALERFIWALALSVPLAIVTFAVADNVNTPEVLRWVSSPGYVLALHAPPERTFAESLGRGIEIGIGVNMAYYWLILLGLLKILSWRSSLPARIQHKS
jgi:hypothetical protein